MVELFQNLLDNWADYAVGITTIVTGASIIAKLTPTMADDSALKWVEKVLNMVAINKK